jgi:tRNA dimethylallyltransferase
VGATGTGKTAVSLALARRLGAEIVCCDSRQLYRDLEAATGKPSPAGRARVPHHLFDALGVTERASAGRYEQLAVPVLQAVARRGHLPLVVGGSGFYLEALRFGLPRIPPVPPEVREAVAARLAERGPQTLHAELASLDPAAAARISPGDRQRVARALEVWSSGGRKFSEWRSAAPAEPARSLLVVVLEREREALYRDLDRRTESFFAGGLLEEVEGLLARGAPPEAHGFASLAYREAVAVVRGAMSRAEAVDRARRGTRRYAKRQLTWWRGRGAASYVERVAAEGLDPETAASRVAERWERAAALP